MRKALLGLVVASVLWLPSLHWFCHVDREEVGTKLAQQIADDPLPSAATMRAVNPEWDFMRRTFEVLTLTHRGGFRNLAAADAIIDATMAAANGMGDGHFMLPYAKRAPFVDPDARSLFIDGELVLMVASRESVAPREGEDGDRVRDDARERAARIEAELGRSPSVSGESYPNECWTFCNTTALAGLALLDRERYAPLAARWIDHAKNHLVDPKTGLLVSSYTYDGRVLDGPEGSSIWMSAHNLLFLDEAFAREQYARARKELRGSLLGFGWAREWPESWRGPEDVDSGPIIPVLDASAGSSGLAFLGASAFGDDEWLDELLASLELVGARDAKTGHYRASNDVGDAVLAYALSFRPSHRSSLQASVPRGAPPTDFSTPRGPVLSFEPVRSLSSLHAMEGTAR